MTGRRATVSSWPLSQVTNGPYAPGLSVDHTTTETIAARTAIKPMGQELRDAMVTGARSYSQKQFLPHDEFCRIMSDEAILGEIRRSNAANRLRVGDMNQDQAEKELLQHVKRNRKQLFAILSLMEKTKDILSFINNDVDDSHLPFYTHHESQTHLYKKRESDEKETNVTPIDLPWSYFKKESLCDQQFKIHVAIFIREGQNTKPAHFDLDERFTLPFIESKPVDTGGTSNVSRVRIPPSHHAFKHLAPGKGGQLYFAIKQIDNHQIDDPRGWFEQEVFNLTRVAPESDSHLSLLLWTFSHRGAYYLVFPCAESNLAGFMKKHEAPRHDKQSAVWVARQCYRLAQGLVMIHEVRDSKGCYYGRHGDIKPENILIFSGGDEDEDAIKDPHALAGHVKLADFGLTEFHSFHSKTNSASGVGYTITQRAPEYRVLNTVSQKYDIWSMGCVLLELVTWYLQGSAGVDAFSTQRQREEEGKPKHVTYSEDTFFIMDKNMPRSASLKNIVVDKMRELDKHDDASDFTVELVNFIKGRLLRMKPAMRASATEMQDTLFQLKERCETLPGYCTELKVRPQDRNRESILVDELQEQLLSEERRSHEKCTPRTPLSVDAPKAQSPYQARDFTERSARRGSLPTDGHEHQAPLRFEAPPKQGGSRRSSTNAGEAAGVPPVPGRYPDLRDGPRQGSPPMAAEEFERRLHQGLRDAAIAFSDPGQRQASKRTDPQHNLPLITERSENPTLENATTPFENLPMAVRRSDPVSEMREGAENNQGPADDEKPSNLAPHQQLSGPANDTKRVGMDRKGSSSRWMRRVRDVFRKKMSSLKGKLRRKQSV